MDLPNNTTILLKINEATILGEDGNSLLSKVQAEYYGTHIHDTSKSRGGIIPHIQKDNIFIPMNIKNGLFTINIRKPTEEELKDCDVIILTSDERWNDDITVF